jgi:hypothetical protein
MLSNVQKTLQKIKILVCVEGKYLLSNHAREYIDQNLSSKDDIEHCIRYASKINHIEEDVHKVSIDGCKYTIKGKARSGRDFYTTGLIIKDATGEIYFFITAHEIMEDK